MPLGALLVVTGSILLYWTLKYSTGSAPVPKAPATPENGAH